MSWLRRYDMKKLQFQTSVSSKFDGYCRFKNNMTAVISIASKNAFTSNVSKELHKTFSKNMNT